MVDYGFSIVAVKASCFPGRPLPCRSSVVNVAFFARRHPASGLSVTLFLVDVIAVNSCVHSFFVPPCIPGES